MGNWSIKQRKYLKAQERMNKMCEYLFAYDNRLNETPGIYILTRVNPPTKDGTVKKYAYIGQAVKVVERLAGHFLSFAQRIDISLKTRGLWYPSNPYAWKIDVYYCNEDELNEKEREFIKAAQEQGYELYNITSGGQDEGKEDINQRESGKGYRDGVSYGQIKCQRYIIDLFNKYLDFDMKEPKYNKKGKVFSIKQKKYEEFERFIKGEPLNDRNLQDTES